MFHLPLLSNLYEVMELLVSEGAWAIPPAHASPDYPGSKVSKRLYPDIALRACLYQTSIGTFPLELGKRIIRMLAQAAVVSWVQCPVFFISISVCLLSSLPVPHRLPVAASRGVALPPASQHKSRQHWQQRAIALPLTRRKQLPLQSDAGGSAACCGLIFQSCLHYRCYEIACRTL
jgi:hypothetical protein